MDSKGMHLLADLWCSHEVVYDNEKIKQICFQAVEEGKLTVKGHGELFFEPHGYTLFIGLMESEFSVHTYPEVGLISVNIYTCGNANPYGALKCLIRELKPRKINFCEVIRGQFEGFKINSNAEHLLKALGHNVVLSIPMK